VGSINKNPIARKLILNSKSKKEIGLKFTYCTLQKTTGTKIIMLLQYLILTANGWILTKLTQFDVGSLRKNNVTDVTIPI